MVRLMTARRFCNAGMHNHRPPRPNFYLLFFVNGLLILRKTFSPDKSNYSASIASIFIIMLRVPVCVVRYFEMFEEGGIIRYNFTLRKEISESSDALQFEQSKGIAATIVERKQTFPLLLKLIKQGSH